MSPYPVLEMMGRRLRLAVIGGGEGSFIGPMHRLAARGSGKTPDPLALHFPNAFDDLKGIQFVMKIIESSRANGVWVRC
jgi:hypothetical protein